jgi:hypothetical protein
MISGFSAVFVPTLASFVSIGITSISGILHDPGHL